jgi:hypothetical protein
VESLQQIDAFAMAIAKDVRRIKDEHQKMNSKASVQNAVVLPMNVLI